jgi:hypothetical protein
MMAGLAGRSVVPRGITDGRGLEWPRAAAICLDFILFQPLAFW